jgi:hypothetical protein
VQKCSEEKFVEKKCLPSFDSALRLLAEIFFLEVPVAFPLT